MLRPAFALVAMFVLTAAAPPPVGPVPQPKPAAVPVPEEKPEEPAPEKAGPENPAPKNPDSENSGQKNSGKEDPAAHTPPEDAAELAACVKALEESGAVFRRTEAKEGPGACGIEHPVELSEPAPGIRLDPPALLRCEAALNMADWTREMVLPIARKAFPEKRLAAFSNASSYVCRNRNGAADGKVSEHARGNAIDISAVAFSDGGSLPMKPRREDGDMAGAFQRSLTASACLYFTTVLSPGSDATHQDHLHLDVIERKSGYRYCR